MWLLTFQQNIFIEEFNILHDFHFTCRSKTLIYNSYSDNIVLLINQTSVTNKLYHHNLK